MLVLLVQGTWGQYNHGHNSGAEWSVCDSSLSPVGVAVAHSLGGALVGAAGEEAVELAGIPEGGRQQS